MVAGNIPYYDADRPLTDDDRMVRCEAVVCSMNGEICTYKRAATKADVRRKAWELFDEHRLYEIPIPETHVYVFDRGRKCEVQAFGTYVFAPGMQSEQQLCDHQVELLHDEWKEAASWIRLP